MKNLTAWIVGVVALGFGLGAVVSTTVADVSEPEPSALEAALQSASLVDCGEGLEAMLEPVPASANEEATFRVRCIESGDENPNARVEPAPTVVVVPTPVSTPPATIPTAERTGPGHSPNEAPRPKTESRSWKETAVVIGGAAGKGAGIGALAKGKKGAVVGAAIGAASGAAYELIKKDRR